MSWLWWMMLACVLDRTGQSASEGMRRQLADQGTRLSHVEAQFLQIEARVNQLEELTRTRGQQEIMKMESLEELRTELSRVRGEVEVLSHQQGTNGDDLKARAEDAAFRVEWLEGRTKQLEDALGLKPTAPPVMTPPAEEAPVDETGVPVSPDDAASTEPVKTPPRVVTIGDKDDGKPNPDKMLDGAKGMLDKDKPETAEPILERFLQLHPTHKRAAEARYYLAGAAKKAGKHKEAIVRYQKVIDQHKMSAWAPWAMYKQGECFGLQGQPKNARVFYNEVIRIFPSSPAADAARKQLGK